MEATATGTRRSTIRLALGSLAVLAAAAAAMLVYEVTRSSAGRQPQHPPVVSQAGMEAKVGVRVTRVAVSGDGGLLDLRYQVVDADKAISIHEKGALPPLLVDEQTGAAIGQLLMGHIHSAPPKLGLTYYLIFLNPGDLVHRGDFVSVQLGRARLPHIRVE